MSGTFLSPGLNYNLDMIATEKTRTAKSAFRAWSAKMEYLDSENLKKLYRAFSEPYQGTVYHYTNADGISGIIDSREIWMTNTAFVNDTTELMALKNAMDVLGDKDFTNDAVREEWRAVREERRSTADRTGITRGDYYMASFSKNRDSLEQWRGYGKFCIGFDAKKLETGRHIFLYECIYTRQALKDWILKMEGIPEWDSISKEDHRRAAAWNLVYIASMKFKNEHFSMENEIRLVAFSHHSWGYLNSPETHEEELPIHFRPHGLCGFVPYLKFFIESESNNHPLGTKENERQMKERKRKEEAVKERALLPITEVIVGPMAHQSEARIAYEILLSERGYKQVAVTASGIPYRGI